VWIHVDNLWTKVQKATDDELSWLEGFLSFYDDSKARAVGDGTVSLLHKGQRRFPTGLVPWVEAAAKEDKISTKRIDVRVRPHDDQVEDLIDKADLEWLKTRKVKGRPFQFESLRETLIRGRGIIRIPTGGGKGEVIVGIAKAVPLRWLFVVHREHLVNDILRRWNKRGDGTGAHWLNAKNNWKLAERLSLCTFQTLYRNADKPAVREALAGVQGYMVDEVHTLPAGSHFKVVNHIPSAYYRIGLSGTPLDRSDGRSIIAVGATGPVSYNVTPRELMDAGYVATATVRFTPILGKTSKRGWAPVHRAMIVESKERNAAVLKDAKRATKPAMVFVERLKHGRILRDALRASGLETEFVFGDISAERRDELIEKLNRGQIDVLVANDVFQVGVDAPELRSIVNACGGKSVIATLQRVGRGSRITDEKKDFEIYDYWDQGQRWLLEHSKQRRKAYQMYGYSVVMK
jgi:superfamily II DNA or RNA helicase